MSSLRCYYVCYPAVAAAGTSAPACRVATNLADADANTITTTTAAGAGEFYVTENGLVRDGYRANVGL